MNSKVIVVAVISFLLGAALDSAHIFPFHWGIPFIGDWNQLITIGLIIGLFVLYSKINEIEKRINRFDHHSY